MLTSVCVYVNGFIITSTYLLILWFPSLLLHCRYFCIVIDGEACTAQGYEEWLTKYSKAIQSALDVICFQVRKSIYMHARRMVEKPQCILSARSS